eukprot:scaffold6036_cov110-Isochrysis_galbana.AAC.5
MDCPHTVSFMNALCSIYVYLVPTDECVLPYKMVRSDPIARGTSSRGAKNRISTTALSGAPPSFGERSIFLWGSSVELELVRVH